MSQLFDRQRLTHLLVDSAKQLGISLADDQRDRLLRYLELLIKWNKAYNLTAIREPEQMCRRHIVDSLAVIPHMDLTQRILDVGTGPGLPGMIISLMFPDTDMTLLDSNGKKTRFLFQVKTEFKLSNVEIINQRVEQFQPSTPFQIITSRAFASLHDMTHWCQHLLATDGCFQAMKGIFPAEEIESIADQYRLTNQQKLLIPGVDEERHLLTLVPNN